MNDPIALAAELKRTRQELRTTQDQLAQLRRDSADLSARNDRLKDRLTAAEARLQALQIHEAITRIPAQPPDPDEGCGEYLYERPIRDVPTGGVL